MESWFVSITCVLFASGLVCFVFEKGVTRYMATGLLLISLWGTFGFYVANTGHKQPISTGTMVLAQSSR